MIPNPQDSTPQNQAAAVEEISVDELIKRQPWLKDVQDSPVFQQFMDTIAPKIELKQTSNMVLGAFCNLDVNADRMGQFLEKNPYFEFQFLKLIESLSKREEQPAIASAVILLGMQRSRNFILGVQLYRMIHEAHPEWSTDGKLSLNVDEMLKYALKTEEVVTGLKDRYSDMAFAGGLLFDYLQRLNVLKGGDQKILGFINEIHNHGMRAGQLGKEIASTIPDFGFTKYVFAACLIHDVGKVAMALIDPTYLSFNEEMKKREVTRQVRLFAEQEVYGVTHNIIGSICCHQFCIFKPIEPAVFYHHDPHLLKKNQKSMYQLGAVVSMATNAAHAFKAAEKGNDPIIDEWKGVELRDFPIKAEGLSRSVARVVQRGA